MFNFWKKKKEDKRIDEINANLRDIKMYLRVIIKIMQEGKNG